MAKTETPPAGYVVIVGPLTISQIKQLMRMGLISGDTKARPEASEVWGEVEDIPELSADGGPPRGDGLEDILHELRREFYSAQGVELDIPQQLYETLEDYLGVGGGEVFLTQGRSNGLPVFVVLVKEDGGGFEVVAEIEVAAAGWPPAAREAWPETGSDEAKVWGVQ